MSAGELVEAFSRHFMSAHRHLAGAGLRRDREGISVAARRPRKACAATSTRMAIFLFAGWAKRTSQRRKLLAGFAHAVLVRSEDERPARVKLLRTIRLDPSDTFVFERAAEPGEWAVSGAFVFSDVDPATLQGKERSAFRSGFLGVTSLGWSTLVQIVEASDEDRERLIAELAQRLMETFGAPDLAVGARRRRRGSRLRRIALQPAAGHADRRASQLREWRNPRGLPQPACQEAGRSRCAPSPSWKWKTRSSSRRIRSTWSVSRRESRK